MIDTKTFEAAVPEELKALNRWVGWAPDPDSQRPKCPVILSNRSRRASTRKPDTWGTFKTALAFYGKYGAEPGVGVGYVFTEPDGFVYVDIDCALDADGNLRDWCAPFVAPFAGKAYVERSPSGRGLHIIGKGKLPEGVGAGGKANFPEAKDGDRVPEVAMFQGGKYTTITGDAVGGSVGTLDIDCTAAAAEVWAAAGINATGIDAQAGEAPVDDALPKVDMRKVPKAVRDELKECTAANAEDRSAARFKLYVEAAQRLECEEIFAAVLAHDDWYCASGAADKGREQTWADIVRSAAKAETAKKEFEAAEAASAEENSAAADDWKALGVSVVAKALKGGAVEHEAVYGAFNIAVVLSRHPEWQSRLKLDLFKEKILLDGRELMDEDYVRIAEAVRRYLRWGSEPQTALVRQGVAAAARDHAFNPVQNFLHDLAWDSTSRIDEWLIRVGCEDSKLNRAIGRKWIISLVARALDEGCKVDTVLILEGDQGKKKSTLFRTIAGADYFTDAHVTYDRDGQMVMHGHWVIELAELATFRQAEQERTKQFVSARDLVFRAPYAATTMKRLRHFVLVGSTNDDEYLRDPTGNRRYWPVRITGTLDVAWVEENRDQLLAEAVAAFKAGETWWFEEDDAIIGELRAAQEARVMPDTLDTKVRQFTDENPGGEFELATLIEFIGLDIRDMGAAKRIGNALRRLGYAKRRTRSGGSGGIRVLWYDPMLAEGERHEAKVIPLNAKGADQIHTP